MKTTKLKHCAVALAFAACLSAPVALVACGNVSGTDNNFGDVCEVEFDDGRGTIFGERLFRTSVERVEKVGAPSEQPVPESDEYVFVGWNVTGDERDVMWKFDSDVVTNDTILYAVWARACSVTFDANGGEFADGNDTYTVKVAYESKLTEPNVVAPDGNHVLSGWYYGYTQWDFASDAVNSQRITITAKWDLTDDIKTALAPFEYEESSDGAITVTGVKDKSVASLTVPSVVTAIDDDAFKECNELVSAVISDSVKKLGYRMFADCAKLKSVTLPVGLASLPANIFNGCESLESIDIPNTVTSIGNYAFGNCTALKSVTMPVGVTVIPIGLLVNCTALKSVEFKGQVTALGAEMFSGCESLAAFDVPSGITAIPM
ncbi:MAG: leucine-rich repeat protein, partial [Clostridiales bacterium]|nr:leucine-rich repeat protein [Clostridiales bacterium]